MGMLPSLDRCCDIQYTPNCTYENYQKEKIKSYQMLTYDLEKRGRAPKYAYLYDCIRVPFSASLPAALCEMAEFF